MTRNQATKWYLQRRLLSNASKKTISRLTLWDKNKTILENSKKLGISRNNAAMLKKIYGLNCKSENRNFLNISFKRLKILRDNKVTYAKIGEKYNVSRQWVHQLFKRMSAT